MAWDFRLFAQVRQARSEVIMPDISSFQPGSFKSGHPITRHESEQEWAFFGECGDEPVYGVCSPEELGLACLMVMAAQ